MGNGWMMVIEIIFGPWLIKDTFRCNGRIILLQFIDKLLNLSLFFGRWLLKKRIDSLLLFNLLFQCWISHVISIVNWSVRVMAISCDIVSISCCICIVLSVSIISPLSEFSLFSSRWSIALSVRIVCIMLMVLPFMIASSSSSLVTSSCRISE